VFELFVASDAARRRMRESLEPKPGRPATQAPSPERRRRAAVRSTSAAALRNLADRLEPSPSA
jgi:hypothetical protein